MRLHGLSPIVPVKPPINLYSATSKRFIAAAPKIKGPSSARLKSRALIALSGHDAPAFLQGLTTANIPPYSKIPTSVQPGSQYSPTIYSAFLNAQGRVQNDVFIYPHVQELLSSSKEKEHSFLIEVDANEQAELLKWLKRYKLRSKIALRNVSQEEIAVSFGWGDHGVGEEGLAQPVVFARDERCPSFGTRILEAPVTTKDQSVSEEEYNSWRWGNGISEGQSELLKGSALVQESNIDYMGGVDFRKGCYVGQELVIRTQHTGVVRKRIVPVALRGGGDLSRITPCSDLRASSKTRPVGKFIRGSGKYGLVLIRLEQVGLDLEGYGTPAVLQTEQGELEVRVPDWWHKRRNALRHGGTVDGKDEENMEPATTSTEGVRVAHSTSSG